MTQRSVFLTTVGDGLGVGEGISRVGVLVYGIGVDVLILTSGCLPVPVHRMEIRAIMIINRANPPVLCSFVFMDLIIVDKRRRPKLKVESNGGYVLANCHTDMV